MTPTPADIAVCGDRATLLRSVLEWPFAETPRLVFADWLTENIDEHWAEMWADELREDPQGFYTFDASHSAIPIPGFYHNYRGPLADFLAHAAVLFSRHPVTSVRLTDKRASLVTYPVMLERFHWYELRQIDFAYCLPKEIFRRLPNWQSNPGGIYPTEAAANAALSRACVDEGRERAGLRAIEWGVEDAAR